MDDSLGDCVKLYAELRVLIRLVRAKERTLMAAFGRLGPTAPAVADLPGLVQVVGASASGKLASRDAIPPG